MKIQPQTAHAKSAVFNNASLDFTGKGKSMTLKEEIRQGQIKNEDKKSRSQDAYFAYYSTLIAVMNANQTAMNAGLNHLSAEEKLSETFEKNLTNLQDKLPTITPNGDSKYQVDPTVIAQAGFLQSLNVKLHALNNLISQNGNEESQTMTEVQNTETANTATAGNAKSILNQLESGYRAA